MRVEYESSLIEKTVRLAVRREPGLERALHGQIDPIYRLTDVEERDRAFAGAFAAWFQRLELEAPLRALLAERPVIADRCGRCVVHEAARRSAESAELFIRQGVGEPAGRTLVVQLLPESLDSLERVTPLLRRELLHVSDMLSETFGYRAADLVDLPQGDQIVRDRYRVLWDVYVEARLRREGRAGDGGLAQLRRLFDRAFTHRGAPPGAADFESALGIARVTHDELLSMAREPERLRGAPTAAAGRPSTGCPLCGFPTYDWFDFATQADGEAARIISLARSDWSPAAGACRTCVEIYVSGLTAIECRFSACSGDSASRQRGNRDLDGDADTAPVVDVAAGDVG